MLKQPSNFHPKGRLKEVKGTAQIPVTGGMCYVVYIANDNGEYAGPTRWPAAESGYKSWYRSSFGKMNLGKTKILTVQSDASVAHCLAIHGNELSLEALQSAFNELGEEMFRNGEGTVHIDKTEPWEEISKAVEEQLLKRGINVFVYTGE